MLLQVVVASKFDNRLKEFAERWEVDRYLSATGYLHPNAKPFFVALPKVCLLKSAQTVAGIAFAAGKQLFHSSVMYSARTTSCITGCMGSHFCVHQDIFNPVTGLLPYSQRYTPSLESSAVHICLCKGPVNYKISA